jgi:ATP-dependent 26S proteasome regulatory subunit
VLDPALLRSGRLDRKIEFPAPNEDARVEIMQIHSRRMNYDKNDVNFKELARTTEGFNGAQMKAVCVEAGMSALKRDANIIGQLMSARGLHRGNKCGAGEEKESIKLLRLEKNIYLTTQLIE